MIAPFLRPPVRLVAVGCLLAVVVLGGLGQAGVLTPKMRASQAAGDDGRFGWTSDQNVSWRAWKISDPHVIDVKSTQPIGANKTTRVALVASQSFPTDYGAGAVSSLEVAPGRTFYVEALLPATDCDRGTSSSPRVSVSIDVATPFGKRTISAPVFISCE